MAAVLHHGADIVTRDSHKVSDEGVSKAVACPAVSLPIIEFSQASGSEAGPSDRVIKRGRCCASEYKGAAAEGRVSAERFRLSTSLSNATADYPLDTFAEVAGAM